MSLCPPEATAFGGNAQVTSGVDYAANEEEDVAQAERTKCANRKGAMKNE